MHNITFTMYVFEHDNIFEVAKFMDKKMRNYISREEYNNKCCLPDIVGHIVDGNDGTLLMEARVVFTEPNEEIAFITGVEELQFAIAWTIEDGVLQHNGRYERRTQE